ncbi:hypothetical protein KHA94_13560 [Bacillus sp. FJAT-49705]|uniref:Replication protein n=1 Tax=Cytobacillus citreus TaxID=2833586 RepID=A0ABS5NTQ1_9BACI|nr:hypothetical protein [Cytobacillus citreus]MBS4191210.1 hypothetical protein [Cytobacillus citreus]
MRTRQKRNLIKGSKEEMRNEVRTLIEENGMKYVLINNGVFDHLYIQKELEGTDETELKQGQMKFTELDMVVYIFLQFMMVNKFTLKQQRIADYIGCSSKQLKVSLERLWNFKGSTNAKYSPYEDKVQIVEEREVRLISEKEHVAYNPKIKKNVKTLHWYTNYIPSYQVKKKGVNETLVPINFFMVTIEDFDLLTNGVLSRNEFITYLFFLKTYKYGTRDGSQMYWKLSTIAEALNYRLVETVHKHVEKLLSVKINDVPLLEETRPNNYELQILKGEEPSSRYIPRFNPLKMSEMNFGKEEMDSKKEEMSFNESETGSENKEMSFRNEEIDSLELENVFG